MPINNNNKIVVGKKSYCDVDVVFGVRFNLNTLVACVFGDDGPILAQSPPNDN